MPPNFPSPKRSLGQNFLLDKNLAKYVVRQLGLNGGELVVEIGPGHGALTRPILEFAPELVILLEKDRELARELQSQLGKERIELHAGDALKYDLRQLFRGLPVFLIGNLPYNISTALITKFTGSISPVRRAVFTIQKEVADRITAKPGGKDYGAYSVLLQREWTAKQVKILPPHVFRPRPRVDSAVVVLERREPAEIQRVDGTHFEKLVRAGFSQRRKQLRKLLPVEDLDWNALASEVGFEPQTRAERLSPFQWQQLAQRIPGEAIDHSPHAGTEVFDVVDEEDRVTGTLTRNEVHANGARHRAVHMLIFNGKGELFLQKRAPWKEINPGVWDSSAAGHLDSGENYEAAAHRELEEELGVEAVLKRIGKLHPCEATGNEFIDVFTGNHEGPFRLAGLEISGGAFFSPEQIIRWVNRAPENFSPVFLECLHQFSEELGSRFLPGGVS